MAAMKIAREKATSRVPCLTITRQPTTARGQNQTNSGAAERFYSVSDPLKNSLTPGRKLNPNCETFSFLP
jgi:hypothetical protein